MIYLDHLAATPLLPEARAAMEPFLGGQFGNPTHLHRMGLAAAEALRAARGEAAVLLRARPDEITFTSSGTECANWVLKGLAGKKPSGHLILTEAEHPALHDTALFLERSGFSVTWVPVDGEGKADPAAFRAALRPETFLLATHVSNHDSGAIQDLSAIGAVAREAGVPFFADATTAGGWIDLDVSVLPVDFLSLSPHRFHGPKGVGILYQRTGQVLGPLLHGGRQEDGRRGGTENVAGITGAGVACHWAGVNLPARTAEVGLLRDALWESLRSQVPDARINGPVPGPGRDPRHLSVSFEGVEAESLMLLLDLRGVLVTAASGCLGPGEKYSRVLRVMGLDKGRIRSAILMAPGPGQTLDDIERASAIMAGAVEKIRGMG
ncbi:MAG: cysteine desulfurase family protein [Candidatus Methylacidiphilales bacterium]|nr:cysteine desulfurase family protein [Candidatus Methylacidiphilales bacterium]